MNIPKSAAFIVLAVSGLIVLVAGTTGAVVWYMQSHPGVLQPAQAPVKEAPRDTRSELDIVLSEVRKVMLLTDSETPSLVTVTEAERMKTQSFFRNAENGDKVLIYETGRKAILWRPSTHMIIEVGAVIKEASGSATKQQQKK